MRKQNVAIFICLTMTSCMVGPDYTPPEFYSDKVIAQELKLQQKARKQRIVMSYSAG